MDQSEQTLLERLTTYSKGNDYPMHMPGHKRQAKLGVSLADVFSIDITEIPDFDDLHHPEGILRASLDMTRAYYKSFESFYSVNGSTACVLSALGAAAGKRGRVICASNRHWSVDNAAELFDLELSFLAPEHIPALGMDGGISPERLEKMLAADKVQCVLEDKEAVKAVLLVSPSYEGVVSDVRALAEVCHRYGAYLIVDAAHGAHFHYSERFPISACELGADIVIESVHKTLPSMTQTALLHLMKADENLRARLKHYLDIFVSSSPSYVMMASIDQCVRYMNSEEAAKRTEQYLQTLVQTRARLKQLRCLKLLDQDLLRAFDGARHEAGTDDKAKARDTEVDDNACGYAVCDVDISRLSIACCGYLSGQALAERLRTDYGIVIEKATDDYIIAISTVFDTEEGLTRFADALMEIDHDLLSHG